MSLAATPIRLGRVGAAAGLLLAAVVLVTAVAAPARAHAGDASLRVVLDPLPAALDDLQIEIVDSIAAEHAVRNPTEDPLEVLDDDGTPFFRIGPDGVGANRAVALPDAPGAAASRRPGSSSVEGLEISLLAGRAPGLFLDTRTGQTITVGGEEGEPFLRITPDHVEANLRSPTWYDSGRADRESVGEEPDQVVDAMAEPVWERVAEVPRIGWVDPRAAYAGLQAPEAVVSTGATVDLLRWEVPFTIGDASYAIDGVTRFEPFADVAGQGGFSLPGAAPGTPRHACAPT